jgi:chitinase
MNRIILTFLCFIAVFNSLGQIDAPIILGYFPSWSENWASAGQNSTLREVPDFVTHVFLAFAKPDLTYEQGSFDISGTGLNVPYDGCALKESIEALKLRDINVILSIGGETYWGNPNLYENINYTQIKDLVDDFGFVGIDWDYEPNGSFAEIGSLENVAHFIDFITESRSVMPAEDGYIIACAPAGVGALGGVANNDPNSPFAFEYRNIVTGENDYNLYNGAATTNGINLFGFSATGHMIPVFEAVGEMIDIVAYQGYNTGGSTNRTIMYDAYALYAEEYGFNLAAGTHFPEEPWGPYYTYTETLTGELSEFIRDNELRMGSNDGIMIWQMLLEDATSSAYDYLHIASDVLGGSTVEAAVLNADNFTTSPYGGGAEGCELGQGGNFCGSSEYQVMQNYPSPGAIVFWECALWTNQWWANPGEAPGSNAVWLYVSECTEGPDCNDCGDGEIPGCMDIASCNYDSTATCDDGSCLQFDSCQECGGTGIAGCTDSTALNFNSMATCEDESCQYAGCMYSDACNYNPQAIVDDLTCMYPGCLDPLALNYQSNAGCEGTCYYSSGSDLPMDLNGDCLVNIADLLLLLGGIGTACE